MVIDRKIFFTLLTSATFSGVLVICTLAQNIRNEKISARTTNEPVALESVGYILREYENNLAIFRGESESPYKIIRVNLNLLSDYDREMLCEGIEADSESEINRIIEDLTS
ncbi:MAG: hypothetical protein PUA51_00980 [Oscillospiraceae bacterium]|nr:hypothetical protein [Oscillospiraceae bacterium]